MALDISIEVTSGVAVTEVPEDVATDLQDVYTSLSKLPSNRQATVDFATKAEANEFVRQGKSWAANYGLVSVPVKDKDGKPTDKTADVPLIFARKGTVKDNPTRVSFRIYAATPEGSPKRGRKAK